MKYIFFTYEGEGLPIAWQLQNEGHEVTVGVVENNEDTVSRVEGEPEQENPEKKAKRLRLYDNMLKKTPANALINQMKSIEDKEKYFVFFEMNHLFRFADKVKDMGFHGNFPMEEDYIYEIDRKLAKDFVEKNYSDLKVLQNISFKAIEKAKEFLNTQTKTWIVKPFDSEAMVFLPDAKDIKSTKKQLYTALDKNKEVYERSGFMLEQYIDNVIEIAVGRMYYDGKLLGLTFNCENKTIGSGGVSFQTGCAGDLVTFLKPEDKLNEICFPPIVDEMANNHKGLFFWDASLLIDPETDDMYFGEFCPNRPGYNVFYSVISQFPTVNSFFESVVNQKTMFDKNTVAASTRIFNLNRSNDDKEISKDVPVTIVTENPRDLWPMDVYKKDNEIMVSGYDINLAAVTGVGITVKEAVERMAKNIDSIFYLGKYYRPVSDYVSRSYSSAILNRLEYALKKGLLKKPSNFIGNI